MNLFSSYLMLMVMDAGFVGFVEGWTVMLVVSYSPLIYTVNIYGWLGLAAHVRLYPPYLKARAESFGVSVSFLCV
jgi:hypothetical protein